MLRAVSRSMSADATRSGGGRDGSGFHTNSQPPSPACVHIQLLRRHAAVRPQWHSGGREPSVAPPALHSSNAQPTPHSPEASAARCAHHHRPKRRAAGSPQPHSGGSTTAAAAAAVSGGASGMHGGSTAVTF